MTKPKKINEFLYFALRNKKLRLSLIVLLFFVLLTIFGPQSAWRAGQSQTA